MKLQETGEITTLKTQRILKWKGTYLNVGEGGGGSVGQNDETCCYKVV